MNVDIIRAWKDEEYRLSLTPAQRQALPANPAGMIELGDADLEEVSGGARTIRTIIIRPIYTRPGSGCGGGGGGGGGTGRGTGGNCSKVACCQ